MKKSRLLGLVCACILTFSATTVDAALVVPAGLNPGDKYHVIFTTSQSIDATSSTITYYDNFVQGVADAAGIGSAIGLNGWLAIGSTETVDAYGHLGSLFSSMTDVPIYNQTGQLVSASYSSFWGEVLLGLLSYDEYGNTITASSWTGTQFDGRARIGYQLGNTFTQYGTSEVRDVRWVAMGISDNFLNRAMYALSEEVTVPGIPIPPALWLFGTGLLGLIGAARKKSK